MSLLFNAIIFYLTVSYVKHSDELLRMSFINE